MASIDQLTPKLGSIKLPTEVPLQKPALPGEGSFGDTLKEFVGEVNQMQVDAADKATKFATGEIKDLHEVMASAEEANISLMLLMEIRNKAVDGYKELIRTPV